MFILKKNDIRTFPFSEAATLNPADLETWATNINLNAYNTWMLPQLQAYFGSLKVTKTETGTYDSLALLKDNFPRTDSWSIGLWRVVTQLKRGSLVKTQIGTEGLEHSALVPLILAGLKKHKNILYSEWDSEGIQFLMDNNLYEAATYTVPDISHEDLLDIREQGLTTRTGKGAGQLKKATSQWRLTGIKHTPLGEAPALATTMLAQIWVAHPTLRNNLMILDPRDWDSMPTPLIETTVLGKQGTGVNDIIEIPW
jgi:hypothetical protein